MSATATSPTRAHAVHDRRPLPRRQTGRGFEPGRATLDDRITALWTELVESGTAECPVCRSEMTAGTPCGTCGSELS